MVITEIFPNPTVKQVFFEAKFPNLFYLENKIGDFQIKIMKDYPKSELLYTRNILFADLGPKGDFKPIDDETGKKVWEFTSDEKGTVVSVTTNSLIIASQHYKTYNLAGADKFRDAIDFVVKSFNEVMGIPTFSRIGLRYIDECPVIQKDNQTFNSYYNSAFPIERFSIDDATELLFRAVVKRDKLNLTYMEALKKLKDSYKLLLDFDGFALNVPSQEVLNVADEMHKLISAEYERTIKQPVYEYMKKKKEE